MKKIKFLFIYFIFIGSFSVVPSIANSVELFYTFSESACGDLGYDHLCSSKEELRTAKAKKEEERKAADAAAERRRVAAEKVEAEKRKEIEAFKAMYGAHRKAEAERMQKWREQIDGNKPYIYTKEQIEAKEEQIRFCSTYPPGKCPGRGSRQ